MTRFAGLAVAAALLLIAAAPAARAQATPNQAEVDRICEQINDFLAENNFPERIDCGNLGSDVATACVAVNDFFIENSIGARYHCATRRIVPPSPERAAAACKQANDYLAAVGFTQRIECSRVPDFIDGACDAINFFFAGNGIPARYQCAARRVVPFNAFSFGELRRNTDRGTAKVTVNVPGPGNVELAGEKLKPASAQAQGMGDVQLTVKAKGKAKKRLRRKGKAKVAPEVTYTPTGGAPNTESTKLKLVKK